MYITLDLVEVYIRRYIDIVHELGYGKDHQRMVS